MKRRKELYSQIFGAAHTWDWGEEIVRAAAASETIWGASAEQQKPLSGQNKPNLNQHHRWAQTYAREIIENNNVKKEKKKKKKRDCFLRRLRCVSCDGGSTLLPTCSLEGKERGEGSKLRLRLTHLSSNMESLSQNPLLEPIFAKF